jgi:hypothetical protein
MHLPEALHEREAQAYCGRRTAAHASPSRRSRPRDASDRARCSTIARFSREHGVRHVSTVGGGLQRKTLPVPVSIRAAAGQVSLTKPVHRRGWLLRRQGDLGMNAQNDDRWPPARPRPRDGFPCLASVSQAIGVWCLRWIRIPSGQRQDPQRRPLVAPSCPKHGLA